MGMSIDEAVNYLIPPRIGSTEISSVQQKQLDAYTMARETMRKYQKIEDIYYHQTGRALEDSLRVVVEDGKIS